MTELTYTNLSITHTTNSIIEFNDETKTIIQDIKTRLSTINDLPIPLTDAYKIIDQLAEFPLGIFLLHNKSLDGYWTSYIFCRKNNAHHTHPLEDWIINKSLLTLARERFTRFKKLIKQHLSSNMHLASLPSGLMDDLLQIDYTGYENIKLTAIDFDIASLQSAEINAMKYNLHNNFNAIHADAWQLDLVEQFDLLVSNGLNMYEPDESRLIKLYTNFYQALKENGTLLVSFLPDLNQEQKNSCCLENIGIFKEDFDKDITLFRYILQAKFFNFCSEQQMVYQLQQAGFYVESINYNQYGMLPIAIAKKTNKHK